MLVRRYEMPWRRAYEAYAALAWLAALAFVFYLAVTDGAPAPVAAAVGAFCLVILVRRLGQAVRVLTARASLSGQAMQFLSTRRLGALTRDPDRVFLGFGFEWQPVPRVPRLLVAAMTGNLLKYL